jgi:glycosyltransferase involved in cell wall biosynthesis
VAEKSGPVPSKVHVILVKSILTSFGGGEHAAVRLACALRRRGYPVTLLTRPPVDRGHPYFLELREAGVDVQAFPQYQDNPAVRALCALARPLLVLPYLAYRRKPLRPAWDSVGSILWTLRARAERGLLRRRLERLRSRELPVVAHVFGPDRLTPWIASWGREEALPVVYTETVEGDASAVAKFTLRWTIEAINEIPLVICCSPLIARNIRENYRYRGPLLDIPFLIEDPEGEPAPAREGVPVVIGIVGRLVEHKGHRDLLWAVARLRRAGHPVELVVAGDGPLRAALEAAAREPELAGAVHFTGPFRKIGEVMARIDVLALPSSSEAQPLAITEAMAFGKPVVASDFGGIPDMVEHGVSGLLVPPGDREGLLAALTRLARDPELRRSMGRRGRTLFLASRSSDVVLDQIVRAYEGLLERRPA